MSRRARRQGRATPALLFGQEPLACAPLSQWSPHPLPPLHALPSLSSPGGAALGGRLPGHRPFLCARGGGMAGRENLALTWTPLSPASASKTDKREKAKPGFRRGRLRRANSAGRGKRPLPLQLRVWPAGGTGSGRGTVYRPLCPAAWPPPRLILRGGAGKPGGNRGQAMGCRSFSTHLCAPSLLCRPPGLCPSHGKSWRQVTHSGSWRSEGEP